MTLTRINGSTKPNCSLAVPTWISNQMLHAGLRLSFKLPFHYFIRRTPFSRQLSLTTTPQTLTTTISDLFPVATNSFLLGVPKTSKTSPFAIPDRGGVARLVRLVLLQSFRRVRRTESPTNSRSFPWMRPHVWPMILYTPTASRHHLQVGLIWPLLVTRTITALRKNLGSIVSHPIPASSSRHGSRYH